MTTARLDQIWRHPIKGIGAEPLEAVDLTPERPLPLDRAWAVLEEGGDRTEGWRSCRNFLRGTKGPGLMAVTARVTENQIELSHPDRDTITLPLSHDAEAALLDWVRPIYPDTRTPPAALVKSPDIGMADAPYGSVSIMNMSSLRALSQKAGRDMDPRRFRGNLWLDDLAPWEEFDLVGKTLTIGGAQLEMIEPITRCRATEADPDTGRRDVQTLRVLQDGWGNTEFGINAIVRTAGRIACGDTVSVT